ncbi:MAG: OprD family outer membrane porin [Campylobacterales bacterium]|nr:OprD family outer membrane porin [Campylobacterales bacterium]
MTKLSMATTLLLGASVFVQAADDLASALSEGTWEKRIRMQYFYTDWDDNSITGKNGDDAKGFAMGGSLIYKTAPLYGFSAALGAYTTLNPGHWTDAEDGATATTSLDLFKRAGSQKFYGQGYGVLAQSYLEYDIAKTKIKGGRFLMKNPWITPNDTKMIPIAVEGAQMVSNDIPNTVIQMDYANRFKERGETYFGNMADGLDVPNAIRLKYNTHYNTGDEANGEAPDVLIAGVTNRSIDGLELKVWGMHWDDLVEQVMLEADYAVESGDFILGFGGRYIQQFDQGAGELIKPMVNNGDDDNSIDTSLWALRATANYGAAKVLVSMSETSEDGDMISPWRGFSTGGYTRSKTITDWNANTKSFKILGEYDFDEYVSGPSTILSYSHYDRDPSKKPYSKATNRGFANGDTDQWNLDIIQKLSGDFKGIELKARFMDQDNKPTVAYPLQTSNREMRLEANYRF